MKFKLKTTGNDVLHIFTGGAEVGGETRVLYEARARKKVSLTIQGSIYDSAEQVIYFLL
jgi:hypothetical protein